MSLEVTSAGLLHYGGHEWISDEQHVSVFSYDAASCPLAERQTKEKLVPTGLRNYSDVLSVVDAGSTSRVSNGRQTAAQQEKEIASAEFYDVFAQEMLTNLEAAGWNGYDSW